METRPCGGVHRFQPVVAYEYLVNGTRHEAKRIKFLWGLTRDEGLAYGVIGRYPEGERVTVHYAPHKPELAVLVPGVPNRSMVPFLLVGAAIVGLMGVTMIGMALSP